MKVLKWALGIILGLVSLIFILGFIIHEKEPSGMSTREADQLAENMVTALNKAAWDTTRFLSWNFLGRNLYVWDKENNMVYSKIGDIETVLNTKDLSGTARDQNGLLDPDKTDVAVKNAWSNFCNDGFWFSAPFKVFDPGTMRSIVTLKDGRKGLKVKYTSGGVTPGDAYVWILDEDHVPTSFKIWVSILPIGGLEFTWDNWVTISTGAKLSSQRQIRKLTLEIKDIKGGMSLGELGFTEDLFTLE